VTLMTKKRLEHEKRQIANLKRYKKIRELVAEKHPSLSPDGSVVEEE